jgi:hypothetical protein
MEKALIYTDSRPRAKSTGHAFGFDGNLGMGVIVAGMISVFILTMLLQTGNPMPLPWEFAVASVPTLASTAYISLLRNKKPPRFDIDLLLSLVNGPSFQPAHLQPRHPFLPAK